MKKHLQSLLFYILLLSVFAAASWLNFTPSKRLDISHNRHNSLSTQSIALLRSMPQPLHITAWVNQNPQIRAAIRQLLERYRQYKTDISLQWINPETSPALAKSHQIKSNGTLVLGYNNRQQRVEKVNEQALSNALYRLAKQQRHTLVFLQGHGERKPDGEANHDWKLFVEKLRQKGWQITSRNLFEQAFLHPDREILLIATPLSRIFPQEIKQIQTFIERGGNLLLVTDPQKQQPLKTLLKQFQLSILPGTVVDATTRIMGIKQVDFALVSRYTQHPITRGFKAISLFPQAVAFDLNPPFELAANQWELYPFLSTSAQSWTETGKIAGHIHYDENSQERAGPLDIGLLASRTLSNNKKEQRVIILGDGDFLANAWLGNGGNLELGLRLMNYLGNHDRLLNIHHLPPKDLSLKLDTPFRLIAGFGLLIFLPLGLLFCGIIIYRKRRQKIHNNK